MTKVMLMTHVLCVLILAMAVKLFSVAVGGTLMV